MKDSFHNHHGFIQLALGTFSSYDTAPAPVFKGLPTLTLIQAVVPSAVQVVTQGDVVTNGLWSVRCFFYEIDLLCNLNVEDLKISTLLVLCVFI
jgi:hypothetical protein